MGGVSPLTERRADGVFMEEDCVGGERDRAIEGESTIELTEVDMDDVWY
jgi:hypothetical protein